MGEHDDQTEPEGGVPERYWRFPTPDASEHVAELAGVLSHGSGMQDWPLEVADPKRIDEFIDLLSASTDSDVSFVLMELVLFSLDACDVATQQAHWSAVEVILEAAPLEHAHSIIYWACAQEHADGHWDFVVDDEYVFSLTPLIQPLLLRLKDALGFHELDTAKLKAPG